MGHAPVPVFFVNPVVAQTIVLTGGSGNFAIPPYNNLIVQVWGPGGGAGGGGGGGADGTGAGNGAPGAAAGAASGSAAGDQVALGGGGGGGGAPGSGFGGVPPGSDRRLKTDIQYLQTTPLGLKLYSFRYRKDLSKKYIGVMAQDVLKTPWRGAVHKTDNGFYCVDYAALGGAMIYVPEVH